MTKYLNVGKMSSSQDRGHASTSETDNFVEIAHQKNIEMKEMVFLNHGGEVDDELFPGVRLCEAALTEDGVLLMISSLSASGGGLAYLIGANHCHVTTITTKKFDGGPSSEIVGYRLSDASNERAGDSQEGAARFIRGMPCTIAAGCYEFAVVPNLQFLSM